MKDNWKRPAAIGLIFICMFVMGLGAPYGLLYWQDQEYINAEKVLAIEKYQVSEDDDVEEHLHKLIRLYQPENLKTVSKLPTDNYNKEMAEIKFSNYIISLFDYTTIFSDESISVSEILDTGKILDEVQTLAYVNKNDASLGYWELNAVIDVKREVTAKMVIDGMTGNCIYFQMTMGQNALITVDYIREIFYMIPYTWYNYQNFNFELETREENGINNTLVYGDEKYGLITEWDQQTIKIFMEAR